MTDPNGVKVVTLAPGGGYGDAACQYIAGMDALGLPVTWIPTSFDDASPLAMSQINDSIQCDIREQLIQLWQRPLDCSTLLVDVPPPRWHRYWLEANPGLNPYCYVAWETNILPDDWVDALNQYTCVFVPSEFNKRALATGGVSSQIETIPHVARSISEPRHPGKWGTISDEDFVFYTIGAWTTRKAMEDTIRAFLDTFNGDEPVGLVVKTDAVDQIVYQSSSNTERRQNQNKLFVWWTLSKIISDYKNPAKIHLLAGEIPPTEIDRLHHRGDCFVSLAHSEGWGLGAFDAALLGNPVIMTGWGGQLDFLGEDTGLLVDYELRATSEFRPDGHFLHDPNARWASADRKHASELMRAVYLDVECYRSEAALRQQRLNEAHCPATVCNKLAYHMGFSTAQQ